MANKRTYPHCAAALQKFLEQHHVTDNRKLEQELGLSKHYIASLLRGVARFGLEGLEKLSHHFGMQGIDATLLEAYKADDMQGGVRSRIKRMSLDGLSTTVAWVRKVRLDAGLSCKEMSMKLGRNSCYVAGLERGRTVTVPALEEIGHCFNLPVPPEVLEASRGDAFALTLRAAKKRPEEELPPFARILRLERTKRKLMLGELCKLMGVGEQYIAQVEGGHKRISPSKLAKLAEVFGLEEVPVEWTVALAVTDQLGRAQRQLKTQDTMTPMGWVLKSLREERGLSHEALARRMDMSIEFCKSMEYGRAAINDDYLLRFAQAFGFAEIPESWWILRKNSRLVPQPKNWQDRAMLTELGRKLRLERHMKDMSLNDIARRLQLNETTVSEFEYGRLTLTDDRLLEISRMLGYKEIPEHFWKAKRQDAEREKRRREACV